MLFLIRHVPGISQSSHCPRNNGDLLDGIRVLLKGGGQCMTGFVIGNYPPLLHAHNMVLLLLTHHYHLDGLEKILLVYRSSPVLDGVDRGFVYHVGKIRAHRSCRGKTDLLKIHGIVKVHIL